VAGAFERQFKVLTVSDAIGYFSREFHDVSMRKIEMKYGRVLTTAGLLDEIAEAY
jgi:isochorismate hydrolase